ncbi:MAG: DUF5683 domain-containing protein [Candidatus Neomarinimicrobiota bacterium]
MRAYYSSSKNTFLILTIFLITGNLLAAGLFNLDQRFYPGLRKSFIQYDHMAPLFLEQGSTAGLDTSAEEVEVMVFPARPLLMSLIIPGSGQIYNKSPWWKAAVFAGVEAAGFVAWWSYTNQAEDMRNKFELFADNHWSLAEWVRTSGFMNLELYPGQVDTSNNVFSSGHQLTLIDQDGNYFQSRELYLDNDLTGKTVLKDRDFYENVGKYDQFVGGWDDAYEGSERLWELKEKAVEDSVEYVHMTKNKNKYLGMRYDNNQLLKVASYAVTAIMFNHVISAIEAVYSSQSAAREAEQRDTSVGLIYDPKSRYGVSGIAFSMRF